MIAVGNLTVGGTGKTPTALWLAEALVARGRRVAIVARGYGKRQPGVVVVSRGDGPLVTAADGGDEAVMLARRFAGPIVTGERRADAARVAIERFGVDTIVLDDGVQHRALARDADLVLLPDAPGPGTGCCRRVRCASPSARSPGRARCWWSDATARGRPRRRHLRAFPCSAADCVAEALVRVVDDDGCPKRSRRSVASRSPS